MSAQETARELADQAAVWATRIDAGSVEPETDESLHRWLDEDPRRCGALLRAEAALNFVDRGRALAGVISRPPPRPRWIRRKLMAAGVALTVGIAGLAFLPRGSHHYGTELGEIRQVPLSDGSVVGDQTPIVLWWMSRCTLLCVRLRSIGARRGSRLPTTASDRSS